MPRDTFQRYTYTDIDINKRIKEFYEEVKKYKLEDIICINETNIKSLQKRQHCYSETVSDVL